MRKFFSVLLVSAAWILPLRSQTVPIGTWKSYTNVLDIRDGDLADSLVLAATSGGLFRYDRTSDTFTLTTNADGLSTNDLTAVGSDSKGRIWVGGEDGEIQVIDPKGGAIRDIMDISLSPRLQKDVRRFVEEGDTMFVVAQFGVSVFRTDKWEFGDTYANFSPSASVDVRDAAVYNDSLWIASGSGLFVGWLGSLNLSAPTSWNSAPPGGVPSSDVRALIVHDDTLYAGTSGGFSVNGGTGWTVVPSSAGVPIQRIVPAANGLRMLSVQAGQTLVYALSAAFGPAIGAAPVFAGPSNDVVYDPSDSSYWLMTSASGMLHSGSGGWISKNPDAPHIGVFYHVAVGGNGTVWAGSGINAGGRGFARFTPGADGSKRWKTFTTADHPVMATNDYYRANPLGNGSVWMSSWGSGVVELKGDSIVRKIDATSVPSVASSVPGDATFAVVGGVAEGRDGSVWMVNRTAVNGNVLARLKSDGQMEYVQNQLPGSEGRFTSLVIDRFGTLWLANSEPTAKASSGLLYYSEDRTVAGTASSGGWGMLTANDGLPNNTVISLAVDQDGDIWVGTDLGVSIITDPQSPGSRRLSSFPLREQSIQSIAVDALNRKWVGTKEGVFVVSSDGARLLQQYTVSNTNGSLIDNDVRSIAIDRGRGVVYMGTEKGLSAMWIAAVTTERSFSRMEIGPNPFLVPSSGMLSIRKLVDNSVIKIVSIDGQKVSEFAAQGGGRAFWDGRDDTGSFVPSGVYLIIAFAENGEQVTRGKVVVVRR